MTDEEAQVLLSELLDRSYFKDGERVLAPGAVRELAKKFKMSDRNIQRRWAFALSSRKELGFYTCSSQKKSNSGRPILYNREDLQKAMEDIPAFERGNLRSLANRLGVSVKVVWKMKIEERVIHPLTNSIKPFLTNEHKLHRLAYAGRSY